MRIWILTLAIAVGVASWLSVPTADSGVCGDTDNDGVGPCSGIGDNCTLVPNGPLLGTGSCVAQEDGDMDGYGNPCDGDFNNDGAAGPDDLSTMLSAVIAVDPSLNTDLNCDGAAGPDDLSNELSQVIAVLPPGPSGLACAGSVPCP